MPTVIYDYNKCTGVGECADMCPVEILEVSENGNWCKPIDDEVDNEEAIEEFQEKVENEDGPVDVTIEFELPECTACLVCENSCPHDAIKVEE